MNKVAHYLQEHLVGEVMTSPDISSYFSTDCSIFRLPPAIIAYPRNENDVRKANRFAWQLAERGRVIPITARGSGSDLAGAALGKGIMLVFPAHMNKILELDTRSGSVTVEPGVNFAKLQQTLHTHGRFLPPYPASIDYCTIGGAIANNAGGEKSIKYGSIRSFVESLRVVLANGEVISTKRLSKRELSKKMGLSTFEGEIYRSLDTLIEENQDIIQNLAVDVTKHSAGYDLLSVKQKDGSFDLTPLIVGSQGTLGMVVEASLATEPYNPASTLVAAFVGDLSQAQGLVLELRSLSKSPSLVEVVDDNLLNFLHATNPNQLKNILTPPFPKLVMLIEFDDPSVKIQKKMAKKICKLLDKNSVPYRVETEDHKKEELWKLRHAAAAVIANADGKSRAVPVIDDGVVPVDRLQDYIEGIYAIFKKNSLKPAIWGHAGNANLHVQPFLDLGQIGDRQKIFRLMEDYYNMVIEMGGSTSGEHNDGRLRAPYLPKLVGPDAYELFRKVKKVFDPHGILNPGVKTDVEIEDLKPLLRNEYSLEHLYQHMPRT